MDFSNIRIGIALSGGGVRASAFHLGVLQKLAKQGLLEKITELSTVSGGTLITGLIYSLAGNKWPNSTLFLEIFPKIRELLTDDSLELSTLWEMITNLSFTERAESLGDAINRSWGVKALLKNLPEQPAWQVNGSCYESGKRWSFYIDDKKKMGDYLIGYTDFGNLRLADAMAASAGFPGLIGPLTIKTKDHKWWRYTDSTKSTRIDATDEVVADNYRLHIWDGGVYDNLGVESLFKIDEQDKPYGDKFNFLIVSNASKRIVNEVYEEQPGLKSAYKAIRRLLDISGSQINALRSRIIVDYFTKTNDRGVFLQIGNTASKILTEANKNNGEKFSIADIALATKDCLSENEVRAAANYPTRLNRMTEKEFDNLVKHGNEVANYTMLGYLDNV